MQNQALAGAARCCAIVFTVAAIVGMAACGRSAPTGAAGNARPQMPPVQPLPPAPAACPQDVDVLTASPELLPGLLPDEATLQAWQTYMVDLGPRFTGSPALRAWHDFLAAQLAGAGLTVGREPIAIDWWRHRTWSLTLIEDGVETPVPVASYFPYSGHTPYGGVTAAMVDTGSGLAPEILLSDVDGRIAFFELDLLPANMGLFYANATYVHDPDMTMTPLTDYTRMSLSILAPQVSIIQPEQSTSLYHLREQGAVGAIVSLGASAENAAGQYTPFHHHPGDNLDVPTLYVDRATGDLIKARIAAGAQARLELVVDEHVGDRTDDIVATLPGMSDEVVIVNTHTDGTSASEENGGIAAVALARYFATLPIECRSKTLVFVLTPGHFHGGIGGDIGRFIGNHPEIIEKAVASLTPEHLGQNEWLDDAEGFHASGRFEPAVFFGSYAPAIQAIMANAVMAEDLRRVIVSRPITLIYFGLGSDLNLNGIPNAAYITGPNMLYSFADNQHLDKVDYGRMAAEIRTFTRVATAFVQADSALLCAGMTPGESGLATGCVSAVP